MVNVTYCAMKCSNFFYLKTRNAYISVQFQPHRHVKRTLQSTLKVAESTAEFEKYLTPGFSNFKRARVPYVAH